MRVEHLHPLNIHGFSLEPLSWSSALFLYFITNRRMGGEQRMRSEGTLTSNTHDDILICHLGWSLCFLCWQEKCQNDGTKQRFWMLIVRSEYTNKHTIQYTQHPH